jgi:ubiquinone/menaquinone biosynthesis C-methylase UbiE
LNSNDQNLKKLEKDISLTRFLCFILWFWGLLTIDNHGGDDVTLTLQPLHDQKEKHKVVQESEQHPVKLRAMQWNKLKTVLLLLNCALSSSAFVVPTNSVVTAHSRRTGSLSSSVILREASSSSSTTTAVAENVKAKQLAAQKERLLGLLTANPSNAPPTALGKEETLLVDPLTKESLTISVAATRSSSPSSFSSSSSSLLFGGSVRSSSRSSSSSGVNLKLQSVSNTYTGNTQSFYDLLEPVVVKNESSSENDSNGDGTNSQRLTELRQTLVRNLVPFIPPPLRALASATGLMDQDYIPMRDLFTNPSVSFAYERGWRESFSRAGFPGPDKEAKMAMDYFQPAFDKEYDDSSSSGGVLVDMSCATGLFTRRFAKSGRYKRVLGCDYSASMLTEARRRIQELPSPSFGPTQLELIRCDVGQIPLPDESIAALHAGAAMHCWPDLPRAVSEIYRVLKPGGRYFASTFLSSYFRLLQLGGNSNNDNIMNPSVGAASQEAFQYFSSTDHLRALMESGGFSPDKISIEVLGAACVVIRCEK